MGKIVNIMGRAHASPRTKDLLKKLGHHGAVEMQAMMDDLAAVDVLAGILTRGINEVTRVDGRLDTKDLAAYVLRIMQKG